MRDKKESAKETNNSMTLGSTHHTNVWAHCSGLHAFLWAEQREKHTATDRDNAKRAYVLHIRFFFLLFLHAKVVDIAFVLRAFAHKQQCLARETKGSGCKTEKKAYSSKTKFSCTKNNNFCRRTACVQRENHRRGHHMKIKSNESESNEFESLSRKSTTTIANGIFMQKYTHIFFFSDPILWYTLALASSQAKS